jgi:hypothetical protein
MIIIFSELKRGNDLKVYALINDSGQFLCRSNSTISVSSDKIDHLITYRRSQDAQNMLKDEDYWKVRNVDILSFQICSVELTAEVIMIHNWTRKGGVL